ncbi:MAG: 5-formyltetrahydrofolate cyclo-ligase [Prevotella sp.]
MTEKKELRKEIRARKRDIPVDELREMSRLLCGRLLANERLDKASTVMMYYPLGDEVDVAPVIEQLAEDGKTVVLPQVTGEATMVLRRYTGKSDLHEGAYGIMEPCGEIFTDHDAIDVAIIPGMAFDRHGNRLGRGKGYYDRFLPLLPTRVYKIGVCFPFQLLDDIPVEEHDISMDAVIN